jgi:hypothetical protein
MRTCVSILLVLTAACSVNNFDPGKDDAGGDPNPVGGDGGVSGDDGIYVSSSKGSAGGDGTQAHPFSSLDAAIAKAGKRHVNACAETYAEQVHFLNGVNVSGGYDCNAGWIKTTAHAKVAPKTSPAAFATNITTATRVEFVDVFAADFNDASQSSIGIVVSASPALTIANATIHAGTGGKGGDGWNGAAPVDSGTAKNGGNAQTAHLCSGQICLPNGGAAGGTNACTGAKLIPTNGGNGGSGGLFQRSPDNLQWYPVSSDPTTAGNPSAATVQNASGGAIGVAGQNGNVGAAGTDGTAGAPVGAFSPNGDYTAADGTNGTDGQPGQSGGGAGGVYITSVTGYGSPSGNQYGWSEGGAGGGAGGCGGVGATFGKGGGASFAIIALQSGFVLDHVTIETSAAGDGGAAGRPSDPTTGGFGGSIGQATKVGGNGGMGGRAGVSGNGAGGPSIGIVYRGTKPQQLASPITAGAGGHGVAARAYNDGTLIPASPDGTSSNDYAL